MALAASIRPTWRRFCMTVLGLKLSRRSMPFHRCMGVSAPCGSVSIPAVRDACHRHITTACMFRPGWRRKCPAVRSLSRIDWQANSGNPRTWEEIEKVDDGELWETHLALKSSCSICTAEGQEQAQRRNENATALQALGKILSPDALTIGFARRFATYKRANLLLRISSGSAPWSTTQAPCPIRLCGQGASARRAGKEVLQQIAQMMRDSSFSHKFVFVEDYDITWRVTWCRASMYGLTIRGALWRLQAPADKKSFSMVA